LRITAFQKWGLKAELPAKNRLRITTPLPRKQKPIKLKVVALTLLGMYTVFVFAVFAIFQKHGVNHEETLVEVGNFGFFRKNTGDASRANILGLKEEGPVNMKADEIHSLLTGSLIQNLDIQSIPVELPMAVADNGMEGLGDNRSTMEVIKDTLNAARFGNRMYISDAAAQKNDSKFVIPPNKRKRDIPMLTAYCQPINQTEWKMQPLPIRQRNDLLKVSFPHVNSCMALTSQFPIDNPPVDLDPFLPWIHDVFPSSDGKYVMFVSQNRRRCYNGQKNVSHTDVIPEGVVANNGYVHVDPGKNYYMRPQAALFQHVPVKRINNDLVGDGDGEEDEPRYRLASHEDADADGMETRFICRFKLYDTATSITSIIGYSLSKYELDYDYLSFRKGYPFTHTEAGYDNHMIWTSQLLFRCPIPTKYHNMVARGDVVTDDYSTLFVDVVPIRTAPRYTPPREFLPPRYNQTDVSGDFIADKVWGKEHVLPKIDNSGRWENIPICMPSLMQHGVVKKGADLELLRIPEAILGKKRKTKDVPIKEMGVKIHKVIACTWASTTFRTRGNRANVEDGERRLKEWLEFNLLAGFDHIYVYDNSGAFGSENSLAEVVKLFPGKVTRVDWPCKICSNLDGSEGERSSQYAAESSCRLRFGTHARWLASFDTDEYIVPMGKFNSIGDVSEYLDRKGMHIAEFKSSPAKPRFNLLE